VLVDVPIAVAAARRSQAGRPVERYDADSTLARVAENYRALARAAPATVVVVDGSGSADQVAAAIAALVDERLEGRR
jgi:thymidylate kinase